jgi:betaine-aldehyde dehydrogenase
MATKTLQNFIDGEFVDPLVDETMAVLNPATEEVIADAPVSSSEDVGRAVRAARGAFDGWSTTNPADRTILLNRFADAFERTVDEFRELEVTDIGKPGYLFDRETRWTKDLMRYYAGAARHLGGANSGEYGTIGIECTSIRRREPIGVVGQIIPAGFPTLMTVWKICPALAAGNTVVFKPAEHAPLATLKLAELAAELLPKGVFNVVLGPAETGKAVVTNDDVDMISLTGSTKVGRWITEHAGIKRLSLGLGTTAPAIVFEDADVDRALEMISHTAFYNVGQDCATSARAIVAASIYDEAVDKLVTLAKGKVIGDPRSPETQLGPMVSEGHRERVEGFLARCPAHAEIAAGGKRPAGPGFFIEPAVVTGLRQDDEMIQEEVYGPVMSVQPFTSEEEAIALANGTRYGLTGNLWTNDLQRALRCVRKLKLGNVNVNITSHLVTEMPFGGIKQSGYGQDVGIESIEGYTQLKTVALVSLS